MGHWAKDPQPHILQRWRLRLPRLPKLFRREAMPNGELEALQAAPENAGMSATWLQDATTKLGKSRAWGHMSNCI